jgi:hypothetical protein
MKQKPHHKKQISFLIRLNIRNLREITKVGDGLYKVIVKMDVIYPKYTHLGHIVLAGFVRELR